jgi:hypothetical protein
VLPVKQVNQILQLGPANFLAVGSLPAAAPTCTPSPSGGFLSNGTYTVYIAPIWQNGAEGVHSFIATCTLNAGGSAQSYAVNWTAITGVSGYNVYDGPAGGFARLNCAVLPATTLTVTVIGGNCGQSPPALQVGGPTEVTALGIFAPRVQTGNYPNGDPCNPGGVPITGCISMVTDSTTPAPVAGTSGLKATNTGWICSIFGSAWNSTQCPGGGGGGGGGSSSGPILAPTYPSYPAYGTSNCQIGGAAGTASPAACGSAIAGMIAVPTSTTTYTVNDTSVGPNSEIVVIQKTDNSGLPSGPTCSGNAAAPIQSARVAGQSFTFTLSSVAAVTCFTFQIVNY